jgi:hypothetical protein
MGGTLTTAAVKPEGRKKVFAPTFAVSEDVVEFVRRTSKL